MKRLVLASVCVLQGCAAMTGVAPKSDGEPLMTASARPAQSTRNGRTQTVGLPLSRAGKIGLWAGVAVFLAYLMDSDGEGDSAGSAEP